MSLVEDLNMVIAVKAKHLTALTEQREGLKEAESLYMALYGGDNVKALFKKYAPKLAKYGAMFGLPTGLLAGAADTGAFSGLFNAIGKVFGLFGLG